MVQGEEFPSGLPEGNERVCLLHVGDRHNDNTYKVQAHAGPEEHFPSLKFANPRSSNREVR
jgi:hypothetical protein